MGWLLACRQAYREGIDILYRTNTFHFSSLPLLLDLPRLMPPHHIAAITSVELLWTFTSPDVLNDETMAQTWRNYTQPLSAPSLSNLSSPTTSPPSQQQPTPQTKLHRLSAQLPVALPNLRRLYIALQAHLPPPHPRALPATNTSATTSTNTSTNTTTATVPHTNPASSDSERVLAAVEHVILAPIEAAFRRLGPGPDKEFSLAVQRGGWELLAEWLERGGAGRGRRVFEVFEGMSAFILSLNLYAY
ncbi:hypothetical protein B0I37DRAFT_419495 [Chaetomium sp. MPI-CAGE-AT-0009]|nr:hypothetical protein B0I37DRAFT_419495 [Chaetomium sp. MPI-CAGE-AT-0009]